MLPLSRLLKIALPVSTATTAAIITAYLIAQQHNNLKDLEDQDQLLENIETKPQEFKEEKIENQEEQSKEANKDNELDEKGSVKEPEDKKESKAPDIKDIDKSVQALGEKLLEEMRKKQGAPEADQVEIKLDELNQSTQQNEQTKSQKALMTQVPKNNPPTAEKNTLNEDEGIKNKAIQRDEEKDEQAFLNQAEKPEVHKQSSEKSNPETEETIGLGEQKDTQVIEDSEQDLGSWEPKETEHGKQEERTSLDSTDNPTKDEETTSKKAGDSEETTRREASEDEHGNEDSPIGKNGVTDGNSEVNNLDIEKMKSLLGDLNTHWSSLGAKLAKFSS